MTPKHREYEVTLSGRYFQRKESVMAESNSEARSIIIKRMSDQFNMKYRVDYKINRIGLKKV